MNLVEVLEAFPKEINDKIEGIEYLDGDTCYQISYTAYDKELDRYQSARIDLFDEGDTLLTVVGNDDRDVTIEDDIIEFYVAVKNCWQFEVRWQRDQGKR